MHAEPVRPSNSPRRTCARIAAAVAALIGLALGPATLARAQSGSTQAAFPAASSLPAFSVVSVRPYDPNAYRNQDPKIDPQRLVFEGTSTWAMIKWAYNIYFDQIKGEPLWAQAQPFEVTGVTDRSTSEAQMRLMMRRVLAERFQLKFTETNAPQTVYALEIAPGGSKLKPETSKWTCAKGVDMDSPLIKALPRDALVGAEDCTIAQLLEGLNTRVPDGLPVIDKTGLSGRYSILLWQNNTGHQLANGNFRFDSIEPLNSALKREMGLELVKTTAPWRILHITHIEQPTPN